MFVMESKYVVILFYKFIHIADPKALMDSHRAKGKELGLLGRLLIAPEGINGTFEGTEESIESYKEFLHSDERFKDVVFKESEGNGECFSKLMVKVRPEVVTLGTPDFDIKNETAKELTAKELQEWYESGKDFVVLDLRNDFEIEVGKFDKTVDPGLANFRDLPKDMPKIKSLKGKTIVSVCTGGIRCEKATCLLKREGFKDVYQLKDGIHTYMKEYPGQHFKGALFVFDNRMVTDVVSTPNKEVIGKCKFCAKPTEEFYSDDNFRPSKKVLCCQECIEGKSDYLRKCAP